MKISNEGLSLIKKYEGCKLTAYKCPAGVWTIGYGHTVGVKEGDKITRAQAELYLLADIERFEKNVEQYNKYKWTQNEFDALVSFAYNVGSIDKLTAGGTRTKQVIAEKILLYNKAGGQVLAGLTKRRAEEQALFLKESTVTEQSGIVEYSLSRDGNKYIAKNFQVKEFRCKDGSDKILVDVDFVKDKLQKIRDHFGAPVTINSAYRTVTYNKKVGGASKSYHMAGQAFDIVVKGKTPAEVARYAQQIGVTGIIQYNSFVHVDSRNTKYWARNDNGKVTVKSGF
ncbi:MAG: glycoside hydrolase family protein [Lachnospiraceae bacterium]|nr:glycoside hydrolase family protein [Lachnospiraceae bacterium]